MNRQKGVALLFILLALVQGIRFFLVINFPIGLEGYFNTAFYGQFGALAIAVELFIAGIYLYLNLEKTNFALGLFGFTALLDPVFNALGIFQSQVPADATILFVIAGISALILAFTNTFSLGRISLAGTLISFVLGCAVEFFFNNAWPW